MTPAWFRVFSACSLALLAAACGGTLTPTSTGGPQTGSAGGNATLAGNASMQSGNGSAGSGAATSSGRRESVTPTMMAGGGDSTTPAMGSAGQGGASGSGGASGGASSGGGTNGQNQGGGQGGSAGSAGSGGTSGGAAGSADPGHLIFTGDFETGDLSQWHYVERCQPDRITVYSAANAPAGAPPPRQGDYAALFHVLDTDVSPCTSTGDPRAELETAESLLKPGDEVWEAWSMYIPSSHPSCGSCSKWFAFQEDYGSPWDGPASLAWYLTFYDNPTRFSIGRGSQYNGDWPAATALVTDQWVDFLVHKKMSNKDDGTGFIEAWVDGNQLTFSPCKCTKLSMQTMHSTQKSVGFYLTAYRAKGLFSSFDIYYDGVRIGTTRASVELQ